MAGDDVRAPQLMSVGRLFRASTEDDASIAQMIELLDIQDAMPAARRLRDWAIKKAAVRPGDRVIDLGSGTGTMSSGTRLVGRTRRLGHRH